MIRGRLRAWLSYANVVGTLALFIALGGVSYAAVKLPAHSVGTKQLKTDSVTSKKVRNGTLRKRDFKDGSLPRGKAGESGQDGQPGATGAAGAPGAHGEHGATGAKGDSGAAGPQGDAGSDGKDGSSGNDGSPGTAGHAGPKGDTGATGPTGPIGLTGPQGATGATGMQGATGVVTTTKISGSIVSTAAADSVWQFLGPYVTVLTTSTQRLTAAAMVPIATTGTAGTIKLDFCYQSSATGGALNPFAVGDWSQVAVTSVRTSQAVAGTTLLPAAGSWRVGACAQTPVALNNNDYVNGYVQVTN